MTMPQRYNWQKPHHLELSTKLQSVLLSPQPTTPRLRSISQGHLQIVVDRQGWCVATEEEAARLAIKAKTKIWQRVVKMQDQKQLWMVARAIIPAAHMGGEWRQLRRLGHRSLGNWLQSKSAWNRSNFEVAEVNHHWARRSLFTSATKPERLLLLCEVFTPSCLQALAQINEG